MTEWNCPTCGGPNQYLSADGSLQCNYCRNQIGTGAVICPVCGTVSAAHVDDCPNCLEPLSTIGRVFHRHESAGKPPTWLERNRQQAAQVKKNSQEASEARMETYMALERKRLASIRQSEQVQRSKDRQIFLYVAGLAALVLLILVAVGLVSITLP